MYRFQKLKHNDLVFSERLLNDISQRDESLQRKAKSYVDDQATLLVNSYTKASKGTLNAHTRHAPT